MENRLCSRQEKLHGQIAQLAAEKKSVHAADKKDLSALESRLTKKIAD